MCRLVLQQSWPRFICPVGLGASCGHTLVSPTAPPRLPTHSTSANSAKLVLMWQKAFRATQGEKSKLQIRGQSCPFPFSCFLPNASESSSSHLAVTGTQSLTSLSAVHIISQQTLCRKRPVPPGSPHCPGKVYSKHCVPQTGHKCSDSKLSTEDRTPRGLPEPPACRLTPEVPRWCSFC